MVVHDTEFPAQALQMLNSASRYDLAILDMHMPDMDGAMLARAHPRSRATDCRWCCSARSGRKEASDSAFAATLAKPLRQSQLFDTLVQLLAVDADAAPRPALAQAKPRMDPGMAARHPLAHPAGRGQHGQPEAGAAPAAADGLPRGRGRQRPRGHRVRRATALRRGADGRADAGDGRAGGEPPHRRALAFAPPNARASSR